MDTTQLTVSANIMAGSQKTWEYYTQPAHIIKWNFASEDWQCPSATNDLKVGGLYSARMEAKDGSFGFDFAGVYSEIVEGEKIVLLLADGRKSTVTFKGKDNETKVNVAFDAEMQNSLDMQKDGWQAILNNFKKYVEAN
ncbi:MAG: SRPBCC domain-containing protein [Ginsengibacter sp.]